MPDYNAFVVDADGHVQARHQFSAASDDEAVKVAKQYVDGKDIELWSGTRIVAKLPASRPTAGSRDRI